MKFCIPLFAGLLLLKSAAAAPAEHPALFFNSSDAPQIRARSESTAWLRARRTAVIQQADAYLATPSDPKQYTEENLGDRRPQIYRPRLAIARLSTLCTAGYITGDDRYLLKAREILLGFVRDFDPDDHVFWWNHLNYSDATRSLCMSYDLLFPHLSAGERSEVLGRIRGYGHLLYTDDSTWGADTIGNKSCNHNAIHFGALGLAALVLGDQPDWLARATERVEAYYANFTDPTGYVTEGHSYLGYGQSSAVPFSIALKRSGGPDLIARHPVLRKINDQLVWLLMPYGGNIRTLNDSQNLAPIPATLYHSLSSGNRVQLWAWLQATDSGANPGHFSDLDAWGELFLFTTGDKPLEPESPGAAGWPLGHLYESGRVMLRSAWDDPDAAHVVFTSGYDKHQGHNQQDENSVSLAALGEDFLTDPGYWPDASDCHTTLKINGVEQTIGSVGHTLAYREDPYGAFVRGQAQEAYPIVPSFVGLAERKIYFVRTPHPYLVWRDDAAVELGKDVEVVARYITNKANTIVPRGEAATIVGGNGRGKCLLMVFSEDKQIPVTEDNLDGKSYIANAEMKVVYSDYLKRLSATVHKPHARLLTIALPYTDEKNLPTASVQYDSNQDNLTCTLAFPSGWKDVLTFGRTDAKFLRTNAAP